MEFRSKNMETKMKEKKKLKKILKISFFGIILFFVLYMIVTSSFFIRFAILPVISRMSGFSITATEVNLSFLHARIGIVKFSAGLEAEPFLKFDKLNIEWDNFSALKGQLSIKKLCLEKPELLLIESVPGGKSNLPFARETPKNKDENAEESTRTGRRIIPKIAIKDLSITGLGLKYVSTLSDSKKTMNEILLRDFSISLPEFSAANDAQLNVLGRLSVKSGDSIDISDALLEHKLFFRLDNDFLPESIKADLKISETRGFINKTAIDSKSLQVSALASLKNKNDVSIDEIRISDSSPGMTDDSQIMIKGQVFLDPFGTTLDIELNPLNSELINLISQMSTGISPGKMSFFYMGHLSYSAQSLMSSGKITVNHKYVEKSLDSVLNAYYDFELNPKNSLTTVKTFKSSMTLNNRECLVFELEKPLSINLKSVFESTDSNEAIPLKIKIDALDLPLLSSFLPEKNGLKISNGKLSSDITALINASGSKVAVSGKTALDDLSFEYSGKNFSDITSDLKFENLSLVNFSVLEIDSFMFRIMSAGIPSAAVSGNFNFNLKDLSGKIRLSDFSINEKILSPLPADYLKTVPLKSFCINGTLSSDWNKSFELYRINGKIKAEKVSLADPILYASPDNSSLELDFSAEGDKKNLKNIKSQINLQGFKCYKAVAGLKCDAEISSVALDKGNAELSKLDIKASLDNIDYISINSLKPFRIDWSKKTIELSPKLNAIVSIKDLPVDKMHGFFDASDAFATLGGIASVDINTEFGNDFMLESAKLKMKAKDFSFSSAGYVFKALDVHEEAEAAFEGWTKLKVKSANTVILSNDIPVAEINNKADFDFIAGTGDINSSFPLLNEKIISFVPKSVAEMFNFIKKSDLDTSENFFHYDMSGFKTSGIFNAASFLSGIEEIPESNTRLAYDIAWTEKGFDISEFKLDSEIDKLKIIDISIDGTIAPENKKYHLNVSTEACDIKRFHDMFNVEHKEEASKTDGQKTQPPEEKSSKTNLYDDYDIDILAKLKNLKYGKTINGNIDTKIILGKGRFEIPTLNGNINESKVTGFLSADFRDHAKISYKSGLEFTTLDLAPIVNSFTKNQKPFAGTLADFAMKADTPDASFDNPFKNISGILKARFTDLSIPTNLREKSMTINLILTPLETVSTIGKYIPSEYIPKELDSAASAFSDFFKGIDNFEFKEGAIDAVADSGVIRIEKCIFTGELIKFLLLKGNMQSSDGALDISSETSIGKLVVPLKIKGTLSNPVPNYTMLLPEFLSINTANLLSVDSINAILNITKDTGKSAGKKTLDVINHVLDLKKKNDASKKETEGEAQEKKDDDIDVRELFKMFKKKKKEKEKETPSGSLGIVK